MEMTAGFATSSGADATCQTSIAVTATRQACRTSESAHGKPKVSRRSARGTRWRAIAPAADPCAALAFPGSLAGSLAVMVVRGWPAEHQVVQRHRARSGEEQRRRGEQEGELPHERHPRLTVEGWVLRQEAQLCMPGLDGGTDARQPDRPQHHPDE